ncbi:MAG: biopolymer transporter ExbD [Proteobacteria bacterium]|nr:biopolymer transporter ExbD [Pseudomonadota bacterium]MBU1717293.1 biopolymer transporter ExbD [Pseudomonadota bacterium]
MEDSGFESINIIPLVDVMLVLLTIVLTTSTFIAVGAIPVQLPKAANASAAAMKSATVEIDGQGRVYLDSHLRSLAELRLGLAPIDKKTSIMIRADKSIALEIFVEVMDLVKGLGFTKVSLQTEVVP